MTLRLLLQPIVPDRRCSVERFLDVTGLQDGSRPVGVMTPDSGQAIGLEFESDGQLIGSFR